MDRWMDPICQPLRKPSLDLPATEQQGQNTVNLGRGPQDDNFHVAHLNLVPYELLQKFRCLTWTENAALKEVVNPTTNVKRIYAPLAELLTSLSNRIYSNLPDEVKKGLTKIEFVPNNRTPLTCHPGRNFPSSYAPHVVGIAGSRNTFRIKDEKTGVISWRAIPDHRAVTNVEVTSSGQGDGEGTPQVLSYTWDQLQACPHLPGVYCLDVSSESYIVGWADASGPVWSPPYPWQNDPWRPQSDDDDADLNGDENGEECDERECEHEGDEDDEDETEDSQTIVDEHCHEDTEEDEDDTQDEHDNEGLLPDEDPDVNQRYRLSALLSYLYSLYVPKAGHLTRDRTIKPHRTGNFDGAATWDITCKGVVYRDCRLISSCSPWGRRTMIFEHHKDGIRTIIKDYWSDNANTFDELQVLKQVHSHGIMPGVVRAVSYEYVRDTEGRKLTTGRKASDEPSRRVQKRTRIRLVFQSVGEDLQKVKSLKELLKVFFDLNETHRAILNETGVLHRDISVNNILIRPVHRADQSPRYNEGPKFISDVLCGPPPSNRRQDNSHCLLIDFDHSSISERISVTGHGNSEIAHLRVGTPRYIARAISIGHRQGQNEEHRTFPRMPELSGKARDLYDKTWGQPMYDQYCDSAETHHGATIPTDDELYTRYETRSTEVVNHQPRHDVESMWWTLYITSIQLVPKDSVPDVMSGAFTTAWKSLEAHRIDDPIFPDIDGRDMILMRLSQDIKRTLHPGLSNSPLPKLIADLGKQICPEYELLRGEVKFQDHLHEAMRRLLLDCIVEMEDKPDIEFDTEKKRTLFNLTKDSDDNKCSAGRKRTRTEDIVGDNPRHVVTRQRRV